MNCRIDISGHKTWIDNNNEYGTRPASVEINLLRDGDTFKSVTLGSKGDGAFRFLCLIKQNLGTNFRYSVDETGTPAGYVKSIEGYNIVNTLDRFTLNCTKIWQDSNNASGHRPAAITVNLLQNGAQYLTASVTSPPNTEDTAHFNFTNVPFADAQGKPFAYTLDENPVNNYSKKINGFTITNTHNG